MDLVFSSEVGTLMNTQTCVENSASSAKLRESENGRHTRCATPRSLCSPMAGVPIESLADLAGHTTTRTTATVYRHRITPVVDAGTEIAESILAKKKA